MISFQGRLPLKNACNLFTHIYSIYVYIYIYSIWGMCAFIGAWFLQNICRMSTQGQVTLPARGLSGQPPNSGSSCHVATGAVQVLLCYSNLPSSKIPHAKCTKPQYEIQSVDNTEVDLETWDENSLLSIWRLGIFEGMAAWHARSCKHHFIPLVLSP